MKILNINSIQTFTHSKKSKAKFNNKTVSNINVSQANTKGGWFYSKCDDPSYRVYIDEIKPEINKPSADYEYFNVQEDENGESTLTPVSGEIFIKDGKIQVKNGDEITLFNGISQKRIQGEIVQEVRHVKGYPASVIEYKDGEQYKYKHYSQNYHKINQVYLFDGSFDLSKKNAPQDKSTTLEFQTQNKRGEKMAVSFTAPQSKSLEGKAECEFPTDEGYKTITLKWSYPVINYSFYGSAKDAQLLQNMLIKLKAITKSDEYKEDFGTTPYLNWQLYDAIDYLENIKNNN